LTTKKELEEKIVTLEYRLKKEKEESGKAQIDAWLAKR